MYTVSLNRAWIWLGWEHSDLKFAAIETSCILLVLRVLNQKEAATCFLTSLVKYGIPQQRCLPCSTAICGLSNYNFMLGQEM